MNALTKLALNFSHQSRIKRAHLFRDLFKIHSNTRLLDLGSENGVNINSVLQNTGIKPENVFIADIDQVSLANGNRKFGFTTVLLNESGKLPIEDNFFDVVYCSSVIEHATVTKDKTWDLS
jgi:ubiquinone/menaquinone biosynthesis C-methylase UbiE